MSSPRYKHLIPDGEGMLSGFIFNDEEVILSSQIRKALRKVTQDNLDRKIAIGYNFTSESRELLHENGYLIISLRDFTWTDERYKAIKGGSR
ncbi:hypothetical protein [Paenibacillus aceris]|uniref:Uncharacterized protein n=1 Tax=Paenibacillus aceris TaxID=869555 RepID=A0ABS4IA12_9BACL|nr:hypothetical protein [Paenibacillus aceris]MBP1967759.1 hypothetical protein [Paenibacillus aceris]NHW38187.1 hypothetical protein [Paenibacillus aceris]